jgi:hypothetical protein
LKGSGAKFLSYGQTVPYTYKKGSPRYILTHGFGSGMAYRDESCAEYLLDDIQFALFDEGLDKVELLLSGKENGPISDFAYFTFSKEGLVEAYSFYCDD